MEDLPQLAMEAVSQQEKLAAKATRREEELVRQAERRKELAEIVDFVFWRVFTKLVMIQVLLLVLCGVVYMVYSAATGNSPSRF